MTRIQRSSVFTYTNRRRRSGLCGFAAALVLFLLLVGVGGSSTSNNNKKKNDNKASRIRGETVAKSFQSNGHGNHDSKPTVRRRKLKGKRTSC